MQVTVIVCAYVSCIFTCPQFYLRPEKCVVMIEVATHAH